MPISDQVIRDLRDVVSNAVSMNEAEQLVFRVLPALLDEVESLRDSTLAKDFLALYGYARRVVAIDGPDADLALEGLQLQLDRLAPLEADVRMRLLNELLARRAWPVSDDPVEDIRRGIDAARYPANPAHTVQVLRSDGSGRVDVECDHTFKGSPNCVHCRKPIAELRAESQAELARLQPQLPDGVLHATPERLAEVVRQQLDEHAGRGILPEPELAVPVELGPSLRPRIEALVATGRIGNDLERVVQTLFVLGMLAAEGQDPQAHVGDPMLHVSAEALFVRFGLPHEGGAEAARQRADILRRLMLDLSEWCDEGDPLRPAFAAAIETLPR